jgi:Na+/proline symporter
VIANPWTYALVHGGVLHRLDIFWQCWACSIGGGLVFTNLSWANTLAMVLGWMVLRKMIRIAKAYRITSIADFIGSRYGKSPALAGWVTLIAVVGIVPYIALQLKAVSAGLCPVDHRAGCTRTGTGALEPGQHVLHGTGAWPGFTMVFGARHLDSTERHEGLVAAIAFESVIKLLAFLAVGLFVVYGLFGGLG